MQTEPSILPLETTMQKHYRYGNKILLKNETEVAALLLDTERQLRQGEFAYRQTPQISKAQLVETKVWPKAFVDAFKEIFKTRCAPKTDTMAAPAVAYASMIELLMTRLLPARLSSTAKVLNPEYVKPKIIGDIALSMALNTVPDVSDEGGVRKIGDLRIETLCRTKPAQVVVNCDNVDNADIYVLGLQNDHTESVHLLGWTTSQALRGANRGNRTTDQRCHWQAMSYWMDFSALRPMADLLRRYAVKEINEGVLFEQVPSVETLPIPNPGYQDSLDCSLKPAKTISPDEFAASWRGTSGPPAADATATPKPPETFSF